MSTIPAGPWKLYADPASIAAGRLRRSRDNGDVTLISTLQLSNPESWDRVANPEDQAKMLVFNGPSLVFNDYVRTRPNRSALSHS